MGVDYVKLDGKQYRVLVGDPRGGGGPKRGVTSLYIPRVNYSGADTENDLAPPFSRWVLDDWSGGFNLRLSPRVGTNAYRSGYGIDPSRQNELSRDKAAALVGTLPGLGWQLLRWRDALYAYSPTNGTVYRSTGGAFTSWQASGKAGIAAAAVADAVLYFGSASDGQVFKWDGTAWGTHGAAIAALPNGITGLAYVATVLYVGGNDSTVGRWKIGSWTGTADQTGWSQKVISDGVLVGLLPRGQAMEVISKYTTNGVQGFHWHFDGTTFTNPGYWPDNFPACVFDFGGRLLFGMQDQGSLWQWDGQGYQEILRLDEPKRPYHAPVEAGYRTGRWAAFGFQNDEDGAGLLYYDGTRFWPGPSSEATTHTGVSAVTSFGGVPWWLTRGADGQTYAWQLTGGYRTSARFTTARIDCELPGTLKEWGRCTVATDPLQAGESVTVEYRLDGTGAWQVLGTFSTVGATIATFTFGSTVASRILEIRPTIVGAAGSAGAAVRSLVVDYQPAPSMKERFSMTLVLEDEAEYSDGSVEARTALQQYQDLVNLRRSAKRFLFEWPDQLTSALVTWPDHNSVGMAGIATGGGWTAFWEGGLGDDDNGKYVVPVEIVEVDPAPYGSHARLMLRSHRQLGAYTHGQLQGL